jgi:EAL domain-containing protein (putative c-di-GMP-specific phosphodiesterase class I)
VAAPVLPFGKKPLRTFALFIALPAFMLYVLSAALVIWTLAIMAAEIDRLEDGRGITSMHAALDSFLNDIAGSVSDEGTWDEAYLNVVVNADPAWMDTTWGTTARLGQSYDNVLVTDQAGTIIFGENAVGALKGSIITRYPAARTMLRDLDKGITATGDATTVSRFAADQDGTVGLAAISIHQAKPNQLAVPRESRRILWIARHITPSLLQDIAVRYQTPLAVINATPDDDSSAIQLADADGNAVGTLAWTPDRPGDAAFNHAVLVATAVFFVIGLVLAAGLGFVRRAMQRRANAFVAAQVAHTAAVLATAAAVPVEAASVETTVEAVSSAIDGVVANDFIIEYQPIFDLRAESLVGVEALLRWTRPDKSLLRQEELTPRDRAKLLDRAGLLALRRATGEIAPLLGVMLTIAVTPAQLQSGVFAEKVAGTFGATNFPARRLQLTIDCPLLPSAGEIADSIAELREKGVLIALGEFAIDGTIAAYLDLKLANRVRLASALIAPTEIGPALDAYLSATIEAARGAGLAVTVPGIERKEQAGRLLRLGCREFQGELLAKPMGLAPLTALILAPAKKPAPVKQAG